jgi:hypothetical protein
LSTFRSPHTLTRPLVIAIALMLATPTFADVVTIVDGQTVTTQQTLGGDDTIVIETGGTLTSDIAIGVLEEFNL